MIDACVLQEKLLGRGGAQKVAYETARALDAPIYTGWYDEDVVPDDVEVVQLFSERSRRCMRSSLLYEAQMAYGWQGAKQPGDHDLVIMNKNSTSWYVPAAHQAVMMYGHHTLRSRHDRWHSHPQGWKQRLLSPWVRALFQPNMNRIDHLVVNSEVTQRNFELYMDMEADAVVYPPVDTQDFGADIDETGDHYLHLGRLAPNKNVPAIVEAAEDAGVELFVAGTGMQREAVDEAAGPNTHILGEVSEDAKRSLLSGAKAVVMNADKEDFGIVPVEAFASGTPVIGVDEGFTSHQIEDGVDGLLYERGELALAIRRFEEEGVRAEADTLESRAERYSRERFHEEIREQAHWAMQHK